MAEHDSFEDESQLGFRLPGSEGSYRPAGFDFTAWSTAARFEFPEHAATLFARTESPAECYLLRDLLRVPGALHDGDRVHYRGAVVDVQLLARPYRIDFGLQHGEIRVGVEVDGFEFHAWQAAMSRDYYRARRLQLGGLVLVRFTAVEATTQPRRCWRDAFGILRVQTSIERFA